MTPCTGSIDERLTLIASYLSYLWEPPMNTSIREFQSIGASVTWNPAASSCSFTSSFIGNGCICPEPEVEMPTVNLHGMQPASLSSAFALSRLKVYCIGWPYQTCDSMNLP